LNTLAIIVGRKVELSGGKFVNLFTIEQYEDFVKTNYAKNYSKAKKLMLLDIPEKMIERQMNDTRYISKEVKNLLSKIVRQDKNDEGTTANNLLSTNGQITNELKKDWGLNDIWNELIASRFERLNTITNSKDFGDINPNTNKFLPTVPLEHAKGFNKKRIDHRHHALDALVIACATRSHINYLNNQNALDKDKAKGQQSREDLKRVLCDKKYNDVSEKNYRWIFKQPWSTFAIDTKEKLNTTIISFKQNLRVINKTVNKYERWENVNGKIEKVIVEQTKGDSWAIRKSLHKDTVSGKVNLQRIKVPKDKILTATRKNIDTSFNEKMIRSITDEGVQKILINYLKEKDNNPEVAFTAEGIEEMNKSISKYNNGKQHKPILKVRIFELGSKFNVGTNGNKKDKYVEAAKGTNLFFAIYKDKNDKRNYVSIPFNEVVESQKQSAALKQKPQSVPLKNEKNDDLVFHLSPNDLVYVPTQEEMENPRLVDFDKLKKEQVNRIYKNVSFSGVDCFFIRNDVATSIVNKVEFSALNKSERTIDGIQIKSVCWKIEVNRLGKITKVTR
jgi:CRISPR-associated endonuclease Csn1